MVFLKIPRNAFHLWKSISMCQSLCCQICFETAPSDHPVLLSQLCGRECAARICVHCLTSHVRVSLERFYAGVVPRVRCPICLVPLTKSQWQHCLKPNPDKQYQEENTHKPHELVDRYEMLCRQACSLTPPCCHKDGYTHLPQAITCPSARESASQELIKALSTIVPATQESVFMAMWSLSLEFQAHKQPPRKIVAFLLEQFPQEATASKVLDEFLSRIPDDERRATLLLSFLAFRPRALTRCCSHEFCFNCKRGSHHSLCEDDKNEDLSKSMVQCRSCRATLVKVDGCSAVTCLCGFVMNWSHELQYTQLKTKKLLAVDMFDLEIFDAWLQWKRQVHRLQSKIKQASCAFWFKWFKLCVERYRNVLQPEIRRFVNRWRFQRIVIKKIPLAWSQMLAKRHGDLAFSIGMKVAVQHSASRLADRRNRAEKARECRRKRRQAGEHVQPKGPVVKTRLCGQKRDRAMMRKRRSSRG